MGAAFDHKDAGAVHAAHVLLADLVHVHGVIGIRRLLGIEIHARRHREDGPHGRSYRLAVVLLVDDLFHEFIQLRVPAVHHRHLIAQRQTPEPVDHQILRTRQRPTGEADGQRHGNLN